MDMIEVIEKVREGKRLLEIEIAEFLTHKTRLFEKTYGISPKGVDIEFMDVTRIESKYPQYVLGGVNIDLGKI